MSNCTSSYFGGWDTGVVYNKTIIKYVDLSNIKQLMYEGMSIIIVIPTRQVIDEPKASRLSSWRGGITMIIDIPEFINCVIRPSKVKLNQFAYNVTKQNKTSS